MSATFFVGGTLASFDPARVEKADLVVVDERVASLDGDFPTTSTVDCSGCLVVPGFVVAHTHLYSGLAAGMPAPANAPTSFLEILERVWWRLDRALDDETLRASVRVAAIAAVRAGATCVVDHHESPSFIDGSLDVIAEELEVLGLRALLTYGATDRHGADGARAGLDESERFAKKYAGHATIRGAIGLHAPFTCSDETLGSAADRAKLNGAWLHYHAAEGPDDQIAAKARWSSRLFAHLDEIGLLNDRSIVAHAVDIDDSEVDRIRARRPWVTHQARSNMNNAVGYAAKHAALDRVAIGTDGIDGDVLAEVGAAFFRAREQRGPSVWPSPLDMIAAGQHLASEVFSEPSLGRLEPGAPADLVVLDYRPGTPLSADSLGAHALFGLSSRYVRDVYVAGRPVLRNRKLVGIDERSWLAGAHAAAAKLWSAMESR